MQNNVCALEDCFHIHLMNGVSFSMLTENLRLRCTHMTMIFGIRNSVWSELMASKEFTQVCRN